MALSQHVQQSYHDIDWDSTTIIDTAQHYFHRKILEAINIRRHNPRINRDGGIELAHIYNQLITPPSSGQL